MLMYYEGQPIIRKRIQFSINQSKWISALNIWFGMDLLIPANINEPDETF